jgi:hypothetical protein
MSVDIATLDGTVTKYLHRAGLDERCTPRVLRGKVEEKMKLDKGDLDPYKLRIKKLIIKWWKETQVSGNGNGSATATKSPSDKSSSSSKGGSSDRGTTATTSVVPKHDISGNTAEQNDEIYKALKRYAKALGQSELISGLGELPNSADKIARLLKRLSKRSFELPCALTASALMSEVEKIMNTSSTTGNKRPAEGSTGDNITIKKEKSE